jgi:hypothetical protein
MSYDLFRPIRFLKADKAVKLTLSVSQKHHFYKTAKVITKGHSLHISKRKQVPDVILRQILKIHKTNY